MAKAKVEKSISFSKHPDRAKTPSKRGFAALGPTERSEIARKGGIAAQHKGTGHRFTSDEARMAGLKSGRVRKIDREEMVD